MFTVYHSNQLDLLKSLTAQLMKRQPLNNAFAKEIILVQSQGMGQWLQIQLAEELGISANVHYPFPTQFVWDIYRVFCPDLPKENVFNVDFMTWVLIKLLPDTVKLPQFAMLNRYIDKHDDGQKYYQLANCIAQLFDQYLVYRADWLKTWQEGELVEGLDQAQTWQAILWQQLVSYSKVLESTVVHRADVHQQVISALYEKKLNRSQIKQLPKRIFIFGIVSLPPLYLELFHGLSQYIDVHFMFMNPCRQYWGDIIDHSFLHKYIHDDPMAEMMLQETNPLLASWGKLGRDHLALLQNYHKQDIDAFFDYDSRSLLSSIQQSILEMENYAITSNEIDVFTTSTHKRVILANDDSLLLHACHSEQREVEVLYDYLLSILDHNPDISLNDCVVMVADIDHYAPYIQAVFDNAPKSRYLPYTISDQKLRHIDPIIQGFLLLLELPQSRLEVEYIFDLLEIPAIAKRFNLNEEKLQQLQNWIVDSGIRFGLESAIDEPHSWLSGLNRMLLGYSMESSFDSWQGILPYDKTTGLEAELVGLLSDFIMTIAKWREILAQQHAIEQWQNLCSQLLDDFFAFDPNSESLLLMIEEQWQLIIQQAIAANYHQQVSIVILKNLIQSKFENHYLSHRFLIGKINFCTLMPMRSVPFKVVCLLGMNDGVYPRTTPALGFDLISHHPRLGDRNRRNDDRYLFLEALLSAQQKLYISYIGRDIQTNDERYPSILVDELLSYLKQSYVLAGDESLTADLSAQKLGQHLIHVHSRMPFSADNYAKASSPLALTSYADEWILAAKHQGQQIAFFHQLPHCSIEKVTIDDLKRFYQHPVRELARKRLGYFINYVDEQLPVAEYFNLDALKRYAINHQIVDEFMMQNLPDDEINQKLYHKLLKSNQLPYGAFGRILYHEQAELMQGLIHRVNEAKHGSFSTLEVDCEVAGIELVGWLKNIQNDGILSWRSAKLTIKDGVALWIEHLIFCVLHTEQKRFESRIYGRDDTEWCFNQLSADKALPLLSQLIGGYMSGMNQPLFMPLQSTWQWLTIAYDPNQQTITQNDVILAKARNHLIHCWQGGVNSSAECDDYYYRLYPELTDELIDNAIKSAMIYLLPIRQNQGD